MDFDSIILPAHANPIVIQWLKQGKLKIVPSGCWEWQMAKTGCGYGAVYINKKNQSTHRVAINCKGDMFCLHSCDNPKCANPTHLRMGTRKENATDMKVRKRGLRIGVSNRCSCGKCVNGKSIDCVECRAKRLLKKKCHCGEWPKAKGLCQYHYNQSIYKKQKTGENSERTSIQNRRAQG